MKKTICISLIAILTVLLSSCTESNFLMFLEDYDSRLADARIEQLFEALENADKEEIKAAFSHKAQAEAENFDERVDELFSFVRGEVVSWERDRSPVVYDSVEYGRKEKQLLLWFTLHTDEQSYLIFLADYPINTIESKNKGLYTLKIIEAEKENELIGYMEDWIIPGITIG